MNFSLVQFIPRGAKSSAVLDRSIGLPGLATLLLKATFRFSFVPLRVFASLRLCVKPQFVAIVFLFATFAHAQTSQFLFDANGNLQVQTAEAIAPPQILGQPQNRIVAPGEVAAFSVVAENTRTLTYQWWFNGGNIGGATNDSVILPNVSTNNEGEYRVVLTNPSGSVTSAPAFLMIDSDGDGMADSWELTFFGSLTDSATTDFDGDGSSNLQEFGDATDPTSTNSVRFRLTVLVDGGSVTLNPQPSTFNQFSYTNGQSVTLTATAFPGGEPFHAWVGDIVTRSNPVTLVMTNNKSVFARFTPIDFIWTNVAGGDWNFAANWTPNLVPGSNDSVFITGSTVTLNTPADCADFIFGESGSGATLTGSGTLTIRGNFLWTQGTMTGSGRTVIEAGATLNIANPAGKGVGLTTRTLENGGTILWTGAENIGLSSGAVITNRAGALFHAQNAAQVQSTGVNRFDNAGTFRKSASTGPTTFFLGMNFNNDGIVEIQTGTLLLNGSFTNNGAVTLSPGTTNRLVGGGSASGTFTAPAGAVVEWFTGTFLLNPGAQLNGTGFYRLSPGTVTAHANLVIENFDLLGGTLGGTGAVTIASAMNWTGGTMSGSGRTIISAGVTLNAAISSSATLTTRTLENGGTILWTGAGFIGVNGGAVITNRAGALFHVQNAVALGGGASNGRLDNAGTLRKSVSTGPTTFSLGMNFNNDGIVEIQTGTLLLNGSFTNNGAVTLSPGTTNRLVGGGSASGTFTAPAGAAVEWFTGTFLLNPGAQLNGTGFYRLSPGTVTAHANLVIENFDLLGGTLAGTGAVTIASAMNWTGGTMSGSGQTIISPGATLNLSNAAVVSLSGGRNLENGGTVFLTGAGSIGFDAGAVLTNRVGALFDLQSAGTFSAVFAGNRIDNAGTFRKSVNNGTATISGISFNNSGIVEIQTGTLNLAGGGTHSGSFDVPVGSALTLSGGTHTSSASSAIIGAGQLTVSGGTANLAGLVNVSGSNTVSAATANFTGNTICTNNTLSISGGTANFSGTGLVSPAVLNLSGGTLAGSDAVTVNTVMNWTGGGMSGSGQTIIPAGAALNVSSPSGVTLTTRTLDNGGTLVWTGAGHLTLFSGPVITNRPGALFHVQNASTIVNSGGGRIDNAGTFRKSASTGTVSIASGVNFTNYGTVDLRSGILAANGNFAFASNSLLVCALGGTAPGTGHAQLQKAGTVTVNGALSVELLPGFSPATNDTFTVLTAGTRNGTFNNFLYPSNAVTMQLSNTANSVIVHVTDVFTTIPQPVLLSPALIGTDIKLTWTAVSNATYRLEFNPDLSPSNWIALPGDVLGTSDTASKLDPLTPSNRLYRVRVLP